MYITKETNNTSPAVAMTTVYATRPVLIQTKTPRFSIKQGEFNWLSGLIYDVIAYLICLIQKGEYL